MRHILGVILLPLLLLGNAFPDEKDIIEKAKASMDAKNFSEALGIIEAGIKDYGLTDGLIHMKYQILMFSQEYEKALEIFEVILERKGDAPEILIDKVRLLMRLQRYEEALATAMVVEEKSGRSNPFPALFIAQIYLGLDDPGKALTWLETSVERGFVSHEYLVGGDFRVVEKEPRFERLIASIKDKLGIGKPAQAINGTTVSGKPYTLANQKGSVVLIDFWATWCPPCRAEMPNLKRLYDELHSQGFDIVGVSCDSKKHPVDTYLAEINVAWPMVYSGDGMEDAAAKAYGVNSLPMYFIVDRQGVLRFSSDYGGEKLEAAIREIVKE